MNILESLARIRAKAGLSQTDSVGVWSTFGHNCAVKETPDGGRSIEVVATTDDIDMDGEVVMPGGADLSYWTRNGLKFYADHSYDMGSVAGTVRANSLRLFPDATAPKGWRMVVGIIKNAIGDAVVTIARETGQIGASVGFRPMDYMPTAAARSGPSLIISKWLWLETSFTAFPCNVNCQGRLIQGDGKMADELDRLVVKGRVSREAAETLGLPGRKRPRRILYCG